MIQQYFRILLILGMAAALCGTAGAAGMGIIAETHETSGVSAPVCSAPCECMSLTQAMQRWGADGYDYCSKTVCGQSANADVQYYCLHQVGGTSSQAPKAPALAPSSGAAQPAAPAAPAAVVTQKSPAGIATVIAAMGAALLAAAAMRRK